MSLDSFSQYTPIENSSFSFIPPKTFSLRDGNLNSCKSLDYQASLTILVAPISNNNIRRESHESSLNNLGFNVIDKIQYSNNLGDFELYFTEVEYMPGFKNYEFISHVGDEKTAMSFTCLVNLDKITKKDFANLKKALIESLESIKYID